MIESEASEREALLSGLCLDGTLLVVGAIGVACPVDGYVRIFFWALVLVAALGLGRALLRLRRLPVPSREFGGGGGEAEPWRQRFVDQWDRVWLRTRRAMARRR